MIDNEPGDAPIHSLAIVPFEVEDARDQYWCSHKHCGFLIDKKERTCRCKTCGGEVDPYAAIYSIAETWQRWVLTRQHAEARAKAAEQRLADLERDEKNCRSRLAGLHKAIAEELPADLAEALALLRSRQNYTRAWEARRAELLAKHGGGS